MTSLPIVFLRFDVVLDEPLHDVLLLLGPLGEIGEGGLVAVEPAEKPVKGASSVFRASAVSERSYFLQVMVAFPF
jgi:hypothetical protein